MNLDDAASTSSFSQTVLLVQVETNSNTECLTPKPGHLHNRPAICQIELACTARQYKFILYLSLLYIPPPFLAHLRLIGVLIVYWDQ